MPKQFLIVQTAFLGDVILTLPLVQVIKKIFPDSTVDIVVIPSVRDVLANHPAIREIIVFDKRRKDRGISGVLRLSKELRKKNYDIALVPHRSIRSAVLAFSAQIKNRIGFDTSAGKFLLHEKVQYNSSIHEVKRNLSLLVPLGIEWKDTELPSLYPSEQDREKVNQFFTSNNLQNLSTMVGIAPGTRWNTKRWAKERFAELANVLSRKGIYSILIGGVEDSMLCEEIMVLAGNAKVISSAGKFNVLQSAELIRRCSVLICNDSAPMHLAVAMRTPVVSIFGATIPEFGFAPYGQKDVVIETKGLSCRPCSIHGGDVCPITTFDCMMKITPPMVLEKMATFVNRD